MENTSNMADDQDDVIGGVEGSHDDGIPEQQQKQQPQQQQQCSVLTAARLKENGKKLAAAHIHRELTVNGHSDSLHLLLDDLLEPDCAIGNIDNIEWCRWLVAGGRAPTEFAAIVRAYDNHAKCGLVWIPHVVAYRCRTCGISPCMSICRDCFKRGNHENHDFNMFLSQAGGACDCGDTSVMKPEGFCSDHGLNSCQTKAPVPDDLLLVAEAMMPRLILRMLLHFRQFSAMKNDSAVCRLVAEYCNEYCTMLMEFNNMGEMMRRVMTKTFIDRNVYRRLLEPPYPSNSYGQYLRNSRRLYDEALRQFPSPEPPPDYAHLPALGRTIVHQTLLEEFIFWTFKYEFQQQIVCFLLNMLPDQDYKEHLTRTFVMHYCRIPSVLEMSNDPDTLSNRVVHMSVQLFSNESLALKMVEELSLLHVMIISLRQMMSKILTPHLLHNPERNFHYVVDCAERVMKEHCYWPLVSDFNNVLSHESVALVFLKNDNLIDMWFQFLSMLQGMNVNLREIISHVEYESSSYYAAFSCELEASAYPMWSIISHLQDPSLAPLAKNIMMYCVTYLHEWLEAVNFYQHPKFEKEDMFRASFHFPLHRYLAAFVCQGVKTMGMALNDILPSADLLPMLMMHPLRVQSLFYEILSGVWVRNGLQIKGQAMTYIQANFCNSMVDMDLFFLQICATQLPPNQFLSECIAIFSIEDWLGMSVLSTPPEMEQDSMLEGLLTFLATLITSRINLGNDETTQCIIEISALLATGDKTHSQLLELMPERSGNAHTRNFERFLKELSIYRSPLVGSENLEQGLFMPVPEVWEMHYDPLHVLLRAVHRRDFQNSLDRFGAYVKQQGKMPKSGNLWPPFRLPSPCGPAYSDPAAILSSRILHAIILAIFYRAVHTHNVSEHMLALAVFLLEMAVCTASAAGGEAATSHSTVGDATAGVVTDTADTGVISSSSTKHSNTARATSAHRSTGTDEASIPDLLNCYPSNCLSDNLKMTVHRISLLPGMRRSPVSYHKSSDDGSPPFDSDVEWDLSEDETLMMIGSSADMSGADLQGGWSTTQTRSNTAEQPRADEGGRKLTLATTAPTGAASSSIDATSSALVASRDALEVIPQDLTMAEQHQELNPVRRNALMSATTNSSTSQHMVVEEEVGYNENKSAALRDMTVSSEAEITHDTKEEDVCNEDLDDEEEYEVEDEDDLSAEELKRRCEARRRRCRGMLQASRRSLSASETPQQQNEDIQYHVMDEDNDVIVEDQPMVLEPNNSGSIIPAAHLSDSSGNLHDNDDEADGDEEEAAMNAAIASITPRADVNRVAMGHLIQETNRQRQQRPHEHRVPQNLLHHRHHRSPHVGVRGVGAAGRLIRASPSRASEYIVQEVSTGTASTGVELVIRHEFVSARDGRTGSAGLTGQEIAIPRAQSSTVSTVFGTTGTSSALGNSISSGVGSSSLLPFSRVQPVAVTSTDASISDGSIIGNRTDTNGGAIVPATTTAVAVASSQQNLFQNYYHPSAVTTTETALASTMRPAGAPSGRHPHHHYHHHHMHHHHRQYHSHNSNPNSLTSSRQQQQTPESFQQHTPRHYHRSGLRTSGSSAATSAGPGHSSYPQQWMRFKRSHNVNRGGAAADASVVAGAGASASGSSSSCASAVAGSSTGKSVSVVANADASTSVSPGVGTRAGVGSSAEMTPREGVVGLEAGLNDTGTVVLEESIISLLLKLHSQLSGALDSFSLEDEEHETDQAKASSSASCNSSTSGGQMMELDEEEPSIAALNEDTSNKVTDEIGTSHKERANHAGWCSRISRSRIGDGPYFIGNLLRRIAALDPSCVTRINEIRAQLWPNQRERQAEQKAREAREKEERTKRAKERQKKLMEEFANRQKRFMLLAMSSMGGDPSSMDCFDDDEDDDDEDAKAAELQQQLLREKEYDCIICNTSGPSTESNPIGLVVLVESSSVVGHRRNTTERFALPLCAEDRTRLERNVTLAGEYQKRFELLQWKFGQTSWFLSHNIGWEGGVHIQSCGHHVHLSCQDSYLKSLHTPRSPNNLNVELGEFFCPVCRQLANSVLPLSPALDRPAPLIRTPTPPHATLVLELIGLFQENKRTPMASKFCEAMGRAMGNITSCTQRNIRKYPVTLQSLFSFVISIARTNLEAEVIQRGGSLCNTEDIRFKPKRDCIVPLLHVLSLHVRLMINDEWPIRFKVGDDWPWHSWSRLVGIQLAYGTNASSEKPTSSAAPQFKRLTGLSSENSELAESLAMAIVPAPPVPRSTTIEDGDDEDEEYEEEDDENDGEENQNQVETVGTFDRDQRQIVSNIHGMLIPSWNAPYDDDVGGDGMQIPSGPTSNTTRSASKTRTTTAAASSHIIETETIPDFISDPTALMLKFILLAPLHLDQAYFTCIVKVMYNLLYYQVVLQLCTHLSEEECDLLLEQYSKGPPVVVRERGVPHIGAAMAFILNHLDRCKYIRSDSILMADSESMGADTTMGTESAFADGSNRIDLDKFEKRLQRLCLPFLRIAALLRHHIYHAEIPEIAGPHLEFARLVYYLELVTVSMDWDKFNASKALCFLPGTELALPKNWCDQLRNLRPSYESTRSLIVNQHMEWRQPKLLGLPREYERLFTYYHEQQCQKCQNVPKESSICLLCGTIVCIKQTCCKEQDCCEAVRHSISCGGGTGIFLVITSTYIIIIRGLRACLWGSLYLDDYDEEDRDLKRGKPLYLSEDRFNLLESQWLSHRFAHTKHNWVWHRDSL